MEATDPKLFQLLLVCPGLEHLLCSSETERLHASQTPRFLVSVSPVFSVHCPLWLPDGLLCSGHSAPLLLPTCMLSTLLDLRGAPHLLLLHTFFSLCQAQRRQTQAPIDIHGPCLLPSNTFPAGLIGSLLRAFLVPSHLCFRKPSLLSYRSISHITLRSPD